MLLVIGAATLAIVHGSCPNACSGHGSCNEFDICTCFAEAGDYQNDADAPPMFSGADCSLFTCPRGMSWKEPATGSKHQPNVECSDSGVCDRLTGECSCFAGYEGSACQRSTCPNECSGHGTCRSNLDFAIDFSEQVHAQQISLTPSGDNAGFNKIPSSYYDYFLVTYDNAWDSDLQYGCLCDIGYRGADCSLIECPSSPDPLDVESCTKYLVWEQTGTSANTGNTLLANEWNKHNSTINYNPILEYPCQGAPAGDPCSARGTCDYFTGVCSCSPGFTGTACEKISALA